MMGHQTTSQKLRDLAAANARIKELEEGIVRLGAQHVTDVTTLTSERDAALAQASALRDACEFYLNPRKGCDPHDYRAKIAWFEELGNRFRHALALTPTKALAIWQAERAVIEAARRVVELCNSAGTFDGVTPDLVQLRLSDWQEIESATDNADAAIEALKQAQEGKE